MKRLDQRFDHNGECLICDCWPSDCKCENKKVVLLYGYKIVRQSISQVFAGTTYEIPLWCDCLFYDNGVLIDSKRFEGEACAALAHNYGMGKFHWFEIPVVFPVEWEIE